VARGIPATPEETNAQKGEVRQVATHVDTTDTAWVNLYPRSASPGLAGGFPETAGGNLLRWEENHGQGC